MRTRFWKKTYIITLSIFIITLVVGMVIIFLFTYNRALREKKDICRTEQSYIVVDIVNEYEKMIESDKQISIEEFIETYSQNYAEKQIFFIFIKNGYVVYSSMPGSIPNEISEMYSQQKYSGERYVFIEDNVFDDYIMIYAKYAGDIDIEYRSLAVVYSLATLFISLFLAVILAFALKKLSIPLDNLRKATDTISTGNFNVVADETGKDEIALLAHSFNDMVAKINSQMTDLSDNAERKQLLVDNMAHELRTPLTSILGYSEYIDRAAISDDERIESIQCIVSEAERLQKIAEKILDMSYIRNNSIKFVQIDLKNLLFDVAQRLKNKGESANVEIDVDVQEAFIYGDQVLLSVLFCNLTENAIKAYDCGGTVKIYGDNNKVIIEDNGKGVSAEQLPHLTEPFFRTDKSRSRAEGGAGLGLALCKQIVESHGAQMIIESEIGKGTKVSVLFNRSDSEVKK